MSCMLDCIHICVFLLLKNYFEKLARHLFNTLLSVELLNLFLIAISTASRLLVDRQESSCLLDSFLTPGGSIEIFLTFLLICPSTDPRQLHLSKYIMLDTCLAISLLIEIPLHAFHFSLFCIFSFVSIVSCFFFFL